MNPSIAQNIIQIGSLEAFFGVAALLVSAGVVWGTIKRDVKTLDRDVNKLAASFVDILRELASLKLAFHEFRERFVVLDDRMGILWGERFAPNNSPRKLNEYGSKILSESGIREVADEYAEQALIELQSARVSNPYDAERALLAFMDKLPKQHPELAERLKDGAFRVGASIDALFFVGAIYLRDRIFPALGFSLDGE